MKDNAESSGLNHTQKVQKEIFFLGSILDYLGIFGNIWEYLGLF
jgi:hypothetical protein